MTSCVLGWAGTSGQIIRQPPWQGGKSVGWVQAVNLQEPGLGFAVAAQFGRQEFSVFFFLGG